ncbi:MAG: DUF4173 domain-containing protein [Proteobacteria bacterium]|nr:DUF4173 domain-containing protein [Pseudomonadota bacterium]
MSGKSANNIHSSYKTWIVPISISGIFLFLFALANPLIEQYFSWLIKLLEKIEIFEAVLFFILFTLSWAVLRKKVKTLKPQQHVEKLLPGFTDAVILKSLTLFNLVFLLENTIDSIFLLSGKELPEGITYAQYAHQGAYPLIITTLIAALFVLIVFNKNRQRSSCNTIYNLLYFWIAQNIFLLFSSALRLVKYIDAYSLTEWRVASLIWLALVAIGFLLITIRIIYNYSNEWLIAYNSKVAYLTLFICCFINFESNIALYNIQESNVAKANNKEFDFYSVYSYDHNLIPAFDWACDNAIHLSKRAYFCSRLNMEIEQNLDKMKEWRRFTISRYVAKTLFTKKTSAISMFKEKHHLIISENNYICNSEHLDYTSMSQIYDIHTLDGQLLAARQFGGNLEYFNRIYQNHGYGAGKYIANYILSEVAKNHPLYTILANENETDLNYTMATALMNIDWPNKSCYYSLCNGSICSAIYEYRN